MVVRLADYVIQKGMIGEDERNIYEYAFQVFFEIGLCILISSIIAGILGMMMEGVLFFIIFIPLRSYAGGLHLESYCSCLCLSCLTFSVILLICKAWYIEAGISFFILLILILGSWMMYPVENANRKVDIEENIYFEKRLRKFLHFDLLIAIICLLANKDRYLLLCMVTFFMVDITMIIGKIKNKLQN